MSNSACLKNFTIKYLKKNQKFKMAQKKIEKLIWDICIRIFIYFGVSIPFLIAQKEYFQQHVSYEIDVKLNDQNHTLSAFEKIEYTNNSPDTLEYIWFHIWPNAYKNDSTALAKQLLRLGSTRFHYLSLIHI